ncbi:hypothetical protein [Endozoicomonas lisbonensis]|uniref:Uncharacterized protein n=1 Tax=Endozoicomonas lisbonensis TaxID=3120522 RepID=A0ABV2SC76_9GAMM
MHTDGTGSAPSSRYWPKPQYRKEQTSGAGHGSRHVRRHEASGVRRDEPDDRKPDTIVTTRYSAPARSPKSEFPSRRGRSDRDISSQIRNVYAACSEDMRSHKFDQARKKLDEMAETLKLTWRHLPFFIKKHELSDEDKKMLQKLGYIDTSLKMIRIYHPSGTETKSTQGDSTPTIKWQTDLSANVLNPELKDCSDTLIFVDYFLLNDELHSDQSEEAALDRLNAARNYLLWTRNSRMIANSIHKRWLDCYEKVCSQLILKDPEFAKSPEGQHAKKIVQITVAVSSAENPEQALKILKQQHKRFLIQGVTPEAVEIMCCGCRAMNEKWRHHPHYKKGSDSVEKQGNTLFYGYDLLLFGFRCRRPIIQGHQSDILNVLAGNIIYLKELGMLAQPYPPVVTDFINEVVTELSPGNVPYEVRKELERIFAERCGILLRRDWLDAVDAVHKGDTEQAKKLVGQTGVYRYERPALMLLRGWIHLREGHSKGAVECLKKFREFDIRTNAHLEAARLYFAAGDPDSASQIIDEARGKVHIIRQMAYDQLSEQIEQARSLKPAKKKRSAPSGQASESPEPKRRRKASSSHKTGSRTVEKTFNTVGVQTDRQHSDGATEALANELKELKLDNEALNTELDENKEAFETLQSRYQESLDNEESYIQQFEALTGKNQLLESDKAALETKIQTLQQNLRSAKELYNQQLNAVQELNSVNESLKMKLLDEQEQSLQTISDLQSLLGVKEEAVASLNADILRDRASHEMALADANTRLNKSDATNSQLKEQVRLLTSKNTLKKHKLKIQKNNNVALNKKIDELEQTNQRQQNEITVKEQAFQQQLADARQTIANQNEKIEQLISKGAEDIKRNMELEELQNNLMKQVSFLENQLAVSKQQVSTLENQLAVSKQQVSTLENQLAVSKQQVSTLENQLAVSKQQVSTLENQLAVSKQQASSLENQLAVSKQQVSTLENQLAVSEQQISSLRQQLEQKDQENKSLQNYRAQAELTFQSAMQQLDQQQKDYSKLLAVMDVMDVMMPGESDAPTTSATLSQIATEALSANPGNEFPDLRGWTDDLENGLV